MSRIKHFSFLLLFFLGINANTSFAQNKKEHQFSNDQIKNNPLAKNRPNVIWIMLDDMGFGTSSTFGGLIGTPTLDSLANNGLRFTNFHTTSICSPSRAALLTGRNHHSVGMGLFPETAVDLPGYKAKMPFEKATIAEILRENGYNTFAIGKWHITPVSESTPAGPFNHWPTGRGFEHYYGFLHGETDQWHPQLWEETNKIKVEPNKKHLNELFTEKAISYIANQKTFAPDKPFFLYLAPGATHAPHQVAKEWIDKYKGKFDQGWDKYREEVLKRQIKMGILPKGTVLPPRNEKMKAWDTLSPDEKKVFARFFEVYAGFLSYTDYEIGRIIDYLKQINQLENTMICVVLGDNGASQETTENGVSLAFASTVHREKESIPFLLSQYDKLGSEYTSPNFPLAWAQASNAPFKYWKQYANAEGGTRNPMILFYPKGISEKGGIRYQYSHLIDVLPTTVDVTGVKYPQVIKGYKQAPVEGTSLSYCITYAKAPAKHRIQYYEIKGNRAIYKDGWKAEALHTPGVPFDKDVWELYNLEKDPTEVNNLAEKYPRKLKELRILFEHEGRKYGVFPLSDKMGVTFDDEKFPYKSKAVFYPGTSQLFTNAAPALKSNSFSITAETKIPASGAEGVLLAIGGRFSGISFFIKDNRLVFARTNGIDNFVLTSNKTVPNGVANLRIDFRKNEGKPVKGGTAVLYINDLKVGEGFIETPNGALFSSYNEGFDIGQDANTPVLSSYNSPFSFTGKLLRVIIERNK